MLEEVKAGIRNHEYLNLDCLFWISSPDLHCPPCLSPPIATLASSRHESVSRNFYYISTMNSKPSAVASFTNYFRPHRGEAVVRLRSNAFGLISVFISTWLLPVPSVTSAMRMILSGSNSQNDFLVVTGSEWNFRKVVCVLGP